MSSGDWLARRRPAPPARLAGSLATLLRGTGVAEGAAEASPAPGAELLEAGRARLELALARLGRQRESAFRLLEADALFTYACEAAVAGEEPRPALRRILAAAGR